MSAKVTTRELARSIGVAPATKRFVLRDETGLAYDGGRASHVLGALCRSDKTPDLSAEVHVVAYAVWKSLVSGRMPPGPALRVRAMSPYRICALVAAVSSEVPYHRLTTGGICDDWLPQHIDRLTA